MTTTDLGVLQSVLAQSPVSDRKARLFRVACCRSMWNEFTIKLAREAVMAAEQFADQLISGEQMARVFWRGFARFNTYCSVRNLKRAKHDPQLGRRIALTGFAIDTASAVGTTLFPINTTCEAYPVVERVAPALLRDIIGWPCHAVSLDLTWLTATVTALAKAVYADRDFDMLPILADALEEAGCQNEQLLGHCRGPGPHVRGCWALDLLLGKG